MDLCEFLDLKEREEFKISGYQYIYRVVENKLQQREDVVYILWTDSNMQLNDFIRQNIIRLKKFTQDELVIMRNISNVYEYIARDEDGILYCYTNKPQKNINDWCCNGPACELLPLQDIFTNVKWEDEEPTRIDDYVERVKENARN